MPAAPAETVRDRRRIVVGIGGWVFAPWRTTFYPQGLRQADWLGYASSRLTSIEINGTFYRTQSEAVFRSWHDAVPPRFVFAVKAPRAAVMTRDVGRSAEAIERFLASGVTALADKLGPILWQLPATRRFDAAEFAAFLALLPPEHGGRRLRHGVEAAHPSFEAEECTALLARANVARVLVDAGEARQPDLTADFLYCRLKASVADEATGYPPDALAAWAARLQGWAATRECYAYVISGAKERNPAAAAALIALLG